MPAPNIIQLQSLLAEKYPGVRLRLEERAARANQGWLTGLPSLDELLQGGLPRGALSEIVGPGPSCGSATVVRQCLLQAARENQFVALIDGNDSFDAAQLEPPVLSRLLWARCRSADKALQAADLILRDHNIALVLLDLKANPEKQLGKIPATIWYRLQHLAAESAAVCAIFTPRAMVPAARARVTLRGSFSLDDLAEKAAPLEFEFSERQFFRATAPAG
jgi:hypothetical protein